MSTVAAPRPGTKIELGNVPMTGTCNDLVTINQFTVTLVGTQLQVYAQVTPNNSTDSIVILTANANDGKGKTYAGANFAAGGEGGLPGEMVSVLAFSDLYDSSMTGNTVVASLQAYLLTASGGCWVYQSQPVHL
ncbi:MAG TPA: hypothetical protein VEQ60_16060 [Longimicrobium sp.]|nr:hypothetical protein [Longimicrobium sp.]